MKCAQAHLRGDVIFVTPGELLAKLEIGKPITISRDALGLFRNFCAAENIQAFFTVKNVGSGNVEIQVPSVLLEN